MTTADTGETIDGVTVLGDYHMNGGYDWMELIGEHRWAVIPSWGHEGWDLGQWPYVTAIRGRVPPDATLEEVARPSRNHRRLSSGPLRNVAVRPSHLP